MEFETPRLRLRSWHPIQDARHAMDIYAEDASIRQVQSRLTRYASQAKISKDSARSWAVVQKDIGRVVGSVSLSVMPDMEEVRANHVPEPIEDGLPTDYIEISWRFRASSCGFGYEGEAASQIVRHGFETLNLPMLLAISQAEDARSLTVIECLGMRFDGVTTRCYGGEPLLLYTITAEEWAETTMRQDHAV